MSSTEEAQPAAPEAPATAVQAPAAQQEESMDTTPAPAQIAQETTTESSSSTSAPDPTEPQKTDSSGSVAPKETVKTFKPQPQQFIKPPIPKTIQTGRPTKQTVEQMEEAKLKAKFGGLQKPGGSQFLQKRLNKGMKYFDSGDYNVAKQTGKLKIRPISGKPGVVPQAPNPTGEAIPTPDSIHHRKPASEISKLAV